MAAEKKVRVAIIGATAYTSREVIRWLLRHPQAEIVALCSRRDWMWRSHIHEVFPELAGRLELPVEEIEPASLAGRADLVMLCTPHGVATKYSPALLQAGLRVIDFSADYRLKEPADYEQWYNTKHTDLENLAHAVYGLPELYRAKIRDARLIANPGCYPTSAALGIVPLLKRSMALGKAVQTVIIGEGLSIVVMEAFEVMTQIAIPGVMDAHLTSPLFWIGMVAALVVGFVAALPINIIMIRKGIRHHH